MRKFYFPVAITLVIFSAVLLAACAGPVKSEKQLQSATVNLEQIIQSKLLNLNNAVSDAAKKISKSGLQGDETRGILNGICKKYPYLTECNVADPYGKMVTVAPEGLRRFEGTETATTDATRQYMQDFRTNKKPMLSSVFKAVEGVDGVVLVWPVLSEQGELIGSVSALFKPEALLKGIIAYQAEVRAMEVNVVQTDGLIIYSSGGTETGKNSLADPSYKAYPELLSLVAKITAQKTGSGSYTFTDHATGQPAKKTAVWSSVGLHGTEWRIIGIAELN
jgi:branched-chain amino acid transport system substrate-binding protein